ncbi:energy-coupling factor ABC transporter permease [Escherichia coli]|uniref:energy-coupling factor ABC transporter permease n=1 Tax=Escherichia coli TaxID=562 RepID=UPI003D9A17A0
MKKTLILLAMVAALMILPFMGIFCLTQIPIAIAEGLLTVMIYDQLTKRRLIAAEAH